MVVSGARRSWLVVVGVLGLVGSLLAVGTAPVAGVAGEPDNEATYSACVGPALESRGFVDVVGSFAEDAVNCLAHYGVTLGRTATTYDPGAPVLRWQMALFLSRAAGPAGVSLPADPVAEFTDIGGVFESGRLAIRQMADLGVMPGTGSATFGPAGVVSRAQMAFMLDAFLSAAENGAGLGLGALGPDADELSDVDPDDDVFSDINQVTRREYSAIRRGYELGITRGTSNGQFSPGGLVTRAQMAVFITRMLAHTVARPAGITLQAAEDSITEGRSVDLVVSVRDSSLMGVPDALVDVFSSESPDDAFGEDGRCSSDGVSAVAGSGVCEIALGDEVTGPSGDLELSTDSLDASTTLWAWTGDAGDRYDADDAEGSSLQIAVTKAGTKLRVTDDMPEGATASQFGDRVVFTLAVVDEDGNGVSKEDVQVTVTAVETVTTGGTGGSSSTASSTQSYKTDAAGRIELTFRHTDPRAGSANTGDSARLDLDVTLVANSGLVFEDKTNLGKAGRDGASAADAAAVWRDSPPVATALTLSQAIEYHEASASGRGASNTITAKLTDQYGQGISRAAIFFRSDDQEGIGAAGEGLSVEFDYFWDFWRDGSEHSIYCDDVIINHDENMLLAFTSESGLPAVRCLNGEPRDTNRRTTGRSGAAVFSYSRDSDRIGIETIWASYELPASARGDSEATELISNRIYHYWAKSADSGSVSGRLLATDAEARRAVLYAPEGPLLFKYDSNDHLDSLDGPDLYANFHAHMGRSADNNPPTHLRVGAYQDKASAVNHLIISRERAAQPTTEVAESVGSEARIAASATGVVVIGNRTGKVFVFDGADDASPQVLEDTSSSRTGFGQDVAISDDGAVIAVSAPDFRESGLGGFVSLYTRGPGGVYTLAATLSDATDAPWMNWPAGDSSRRRFGASVDISGDGQTVIVTSPGDSRSLAGGSSCLLTPLPPLSHHLCKHGYIRVYERPDSGWADDSGGNSATSIGLLPQSFNPLRYSENSVSVSDDGSVIAVGAPGIRSNEGSVADAGGVYVYVRPRGGWPTTPVALRASGPDAKLTLAGADLLDEYGDPLGRQVGFGVRISGDGSTIVIPGNNPLIPSWEYRQELYVFSRPVAGWSGGISDYEVVAPEDIRANEYFGQWADINHDGDEIVSGAYLHQDGDIRGAVMLFSRSSGDGWSVESEFLGAAPGAGYGRYAVFAGPDAIAAMDRFGGRVSVISR